LNTEQVHSDAVSFVKGKLCQMKYPANHPFLDYPNTPYSMTLELIILIKIFTNNDNLVSNFIKKCKSVEHEEFSFVKFNENFSEVIWFYYLYMGLIKTDSLYNLKEIFGEDKIIYDNNKKFEYSFLMTNNNSVQKYMVNSEVKTLLCDPYVKEDELNCKDGQQLIKPLFPELRNSDVLKKNKDTVILQASTYYNQVKENIKKIIAKTNGNNVSGYPACNIGVLVINASTSFEEFYSYLFHQTKGLYDKLLESNIDILVLLSLDERNDLQLENLYSSGYIQTALLKPTEVNKTFCENFHIDNYISLGNEIHSEIYEIGQNEYGYYKIMCRDGFLNIIPNNSTEEEIDEYLKFLKGTDIR